MAILHGFTADQRIDNLISGRILVGATGSVNMSKLFTGLLGITLLLVEVD